MMIVLPNLPKFSSVRVLRYMVFSHQDQAHWQHTSWLHHDQDMTGDITIRTLGIILIDIYLPSHCEHVQMLLSDYSFAPLWIPLKDLGTTILWLVLICQPCEVMTETMGPMEGTRWRYGTDIHSCVGQMSIRPANLVWAYMTIYHFLYS